MRDFSKCWYQEGCEYYKDGCQSSCEQYREMKYLMEHSGLPLAKQQPIVLRPQECDLDAFKELQGIKQDIVNFVDNGENLYICGKNIGNGKTSWAIKMLHQYFNDVWDEYIQYVIKYDFKVRGLFIHVPSLLAQSKEFNEEDRKAYIELTHLIPKVDLVVWDEITGVNISNYDYSNLLSLLDKRCLAEKSNIFTGGIISRDKMEQTLGIRLTDRVWNSKTRVIEIRGGDRR